MSHTNCFSLKTQACHFWVTLLTLLVFLFLFDGRPTARRTHGRTHRRYPSLFWSGWSSIQTKINASRHEGAHPSPVLGSWEPQNGCLVMLRRCVRENNTNTFAKPLHRKYWTSLGCPILHILITCANTELECPPLMFANKNYSKH